MSKENEKLMFTARQVYDELVQRDKIFEQQGRITFNLADIDIVVCQKDVVGNIIQEWLKGWLDKKNISYALNSNSQMPPDFYLDTTDTTKELLEVKAFNYNASPGFDIADFRMYQEEIIDKPYMLHVDYLIFGYEMSDDGIVTIKDLWLKKVWEICRCMENWPINLQVKQNVVHKIRPATWYSENSRYPVFESLEDFVSAIEETVYQNPKTHAESGTWKNKFLASYFKKYGVKLNIPRWNDIEHKYK